MKDDFIHGGSSFFDLDEISSFISESVDAIIKIP